MSSAKEAIEHAISVINRSSSHGDKSRAVSDILAGVRGLVETAEEGKKLASQISTFKNELEELESQMSVEEDHIKKAKIKREVDGMKNTLHLAEQAKKQVSANRTLLQSMSTQVENLRSAINSALNH